MPAPLRSGRFASFLGAQFLGAANDNAFKATLTAVVLATVATEAEQVRWSLLATALFPLPFLLLSPIAGFIADRFAKHRVLLWTKAPEVLAMGLAVVALERGDLPALMVVLFLMAAQSAFFSPAKYGLLPEALAHGELSMANGLLQMTTNLAILGGSVLGVLAFSWLRSDLGRVGWLYVAIAVAGTAAAAWVPRAPAGNPAAVREWLVLRAAWRDWVEVRRRPELVQTVAGIAWFYFLGAIFLAIVPVFGLAELGMAVESSALLLMVLSVGIAGGSLLAGRLSAGRVEIGLVPLGSLGLGVFALALAVHEGAGPRWYGIPWSTTAILLWLGVSSGLFLVPLNALLQERSPDGMKGRIVAFSNVVTFAAVLLAAALSWVLTDVVRLDTRGLVLAVAGLTLAVTLYIVLLLPNFLVRLVLYLAVHAFYRIETRGLDRLPRGGALLVANHVSWIDALLVGAATDRMVRFLMHRPYYEARPFHWLFRRMRAIPVAAGDTPERRDASLAEARAEIEAGHLVCIFAEGAITRTGNLLRFRRGFERIADGMRAPIVPVCLDGVWGSIFSWQGGRLLFKRPRRFRPRLNVLIGEPMPPTSRAHEVRRAIQGLSAEAFAARRARQRPLGAAFLRTARRRWRRTFLVDATGARVTFGAAFVRAIALGDALFDSRVPASVERVGLLVPTDARGAVAHLAVWCAGRTAVALDPSHGASGVERQIEAARVGAVLTSAAWAAEHGAGRLLERADVIDLDAVDARPRHGTAFRARALPFALAARTLLPRVGTDVDAPAAIVFPASSPPGEPRGAVLSHHNVLSDLESLRQVFRLDPDDRILGTLPFDTSFGLVGTLVLPAVEGLAVVYASGTGDPAREAGLVRHHRVTVLPLPVARLAAWIERAAPEALAGVRHVVVAGGELTAEVRDAFRARFGLDPLAGFGCAECGPLVSLNLPEPEVRTSQPAHRPGTHGHPLPGIAVRVVDPVDERDRAPDEAGLLLVRGANVMQGWYGDPGRTAASFADGWYRTGLVARQDEDGFLTVLGPAP